VLVQFIARSLVRVNTASRARRIARSGENSSRQICGPLTAAVTDDRVVTVF